MNTQAMDRALESIVNRNDGRRLAGMGVAAIRGGKVVYQHALGMRDFERNLPFEKDTRIRVASVSKTFVVIGALRLRDMGLLDLDADVNNYLDFSLRNPKWPDTPITTRMLMAHTSSLRDNDDYWLPIDGKTKDFFKTDKYYADEAPGYYCYCNLNFGILGAIIEKVSGEKFNHYTRRHILEPMGIKGSFDVCDFDETEIQKLSPVFNGDGNGGWKSAIDDYKGVCVPRNPDREAVLPGVNGSLYSPQGGLRANIPELIKLVEFFLADGKGIISPESVKEMMTPVWTYDGTNGDTDGGFEVCYGLAMRILVPDVPGNCLVRDRFLPYAGHTGSAYGMFSGYYVDKASGDGIVYICNGTECHTETPLSHGTFSQNWIWVEELMDALYTHIFTA
ncbi:MAG: beta-lactamase family protein [Clostridiales bacterium]|nr:beta-lactamase family protein [Clostridiales bacterium]